MKAIKFVSGRLPEKSVISENGSAVQTGNFQKAACRAADKKVMNMAEKIEITEDDVLRCLGDYKGRNEFIHYSVVVEYLADEHNVSPDSSGIKESVLDIFRQLKGRKGIGTVEVYTEHGTFSGLKIIEEQH